MFPRSITKNTPKPHKTALPGVPTAIPAPPPPPARKKSRLTANGAVLTAFALLALTLIPAQHASAQIFDTTNPTLTYSITEDAANPNTVTSNLVLGVSGSVAPGSFTTQDTPGQYGTFVLRHLVSETTGNTVTRTGVITYTLDDTNTDVNGLDDGEMLTETFTVEANQTSGSGAGDQSATITINIQGVTDRTPTFGAATIPAQAYLTTTVVSLTLPAATGGNGALSYAITETLPDGLAFTATTRVLTGTPTTSQAATTYTYTATDSDDTDPDTVQLTFTIAVIDSIPTFGTATIAPQTYTVGTAVSVTLTTAGGGDGALTYAITETLPDGLTFTAATRVLDGTPTTSQAATTYTYTATDSDPVNPDTAQLPFTITIPIDAPGDSTTTVRLAVPGTFSGAIDPTSDRDVYLVSLVTGGVYQFETETGGLPDTTLGLYPPGHIDFGVLNDNCAPGSGSQRGVLVKNDDISSSVSDSRITWTATQTGDHLLCVNSFNGNSVGGYTLTADELSFGTATIDSQTYIAETTITNLTLPAAGIGTITYAITETLPDGLTFTAATRVLSGTPTTTQASMDYTYTATYADTPPTTMELSFTITIIVPPVVADVTCAEDSPAIPDTLALNFGDRVRLTGYPAPPGVSLSWGTDPNRVGTFASAGAVSTTWTAPAADPGAFTLEYGSGGRSDDCVVTVTLSAPISFGAATIDSQTYTAAVAITDLTLPAAGSGTITYAITETLPDGLTFTAATRVLSGIPTAAQAETTYTYTATDANTPPNTVELSFTITINEPGPLVADVTCADGSPAVPSALTLNFGDRVNLTGYPRPPGVSLTWGTDPDGVGTFGDGAVSTTWTAPAADPGAFTLEYGSGGRSGICVVTVTLSAPISFGAATIDSQTYTAAVTTDLTLPAAAGGNTPLTYAITEALPDGLSFDADSRVLSGIPTAAQAETTYTYTATDANTSPTTVELSFTITINEPAAVVADVTCAEGGPAMPSALTMHLGDRVRLTGYPRPPGVSLIWGTNPRDVGTFADGAVSTTWTAPAADPGALTLEYGSGGRSGICVVTVTFIDENNDASLSALALSGGAVLAPAFAAGTLAYTTTVANSVANITVTPTTGDEFATVTVGGNAVDSGAASAAIALTAGMTTNIDVVVTASDRAATQTYTLAVTRTAPDITATPISTGTNEVTVTFSAPVNVAASGEANFASSALNKTHWRFFDAAPTTPTTIEPNSDGTAVIITLLMSDGGSAPLDSGLGSFIVLQPGSGRSDIAAATGAARVIGFSLRLMPADISFAGTSNFAGAVTEDTGPNTAGGTVTATNVGNGAEVDLLPITDGDGDYGLFTIPANGRWTYTLGGNTDNDTAVNALPGTGAAQTVTDTFTINSVAGGSQDIVITITGANDPPVAAIDSPADRAQVEFGSTVTLTGSATDPDSLSDLTYRWSTVPPNRGSFTDSDGTTGVWVAPTSGTAPVTMRLTVTDTLFTGVTNTAEITLNPVATPVTFSSDTTGGVTEDDAGMNTATGDLTPTTSAGATTVAVQTDQPGTYGTFTVTAPGVWTYTLVNTDPDTDALAAGVEMTDTFRVVATANPDATVDIVITVTGANDAPTASITTPAPALSGTLSFVNGQRVNLVGSGEDVDTGTTLTYAWSASPNPGSFADFEAATTTWNPPSTVTTPTNHTLTLTVTDNDSGTGTATFVLQVMQGPGVGGPGLDDSPQIPRPDIDLNGVITSGGRASGMLTVARIPTDQTTGNPLPVTHSILTQPTYGIASITDEALTRNVGDYWNYLLVNNEESIPFGPGSDTPAPADDTFMVQTTIGPDIVLTSTITVTLTEDAFPDDPPVIRFAGGSRMTVDEGEEMVTLDASGSSDPEGGTLMYLWAQNTADDIPVTLSGANTATATFTAPDDRTTLRFDLRVTDDDTTPTLDTTAIAARLTVQVGRGQFDNVHRAILPEVTRAMVDTTVSAIARRVEQAGTEPDASGATFNLGGQSTLADVLQSSGAALNNGTFKVKSLLGRSSFALPLNQAGGPLEGITLWGGGDYRNLSGKSSTVDWDGDLFGATFGGDAHLTETLLGGLAVSWADGTFDYTDSSSGADPTPGDYRATLVSVHPYVSRRLLNGQVTLWATAGYGWGEIEITNPDETVTADTRLATGAVGGHGNLLTRPGLLTSDGTTTVRVKGEVLTLAIAAEQQGDRLAGLTTDARRLRLTLEGSHAQPLLNGAQLTPSVGVGLRHDAGDGRTGTGAEISGGLVYAYPALRLTMESRGRVLLAHGGDYEDWSMSGRVTLAPGVAGHGLAVTLEPTYQTTTSASGLAQLWEQGTANRPASSGPTTPQGLMEATVAYGLPMGDHLLTPYGGMTLGAADARTYRLGSLVSLAQRLNMSLEGARKGATGTAQVDHGVRLQLEWNW